MPPPDRKIFGIPDGRHNSDWWDADHIVPIIEGGKNELANLRTLCLACHRGHTAALARRRADARKGKIALL